MKCVRVAVSYRFLHVTQAKAGWTVADSGTDCTAPLYGGVKEEEAVVLVASNPSSPFSLEE